MSRTRPVYPKKPMVRKRPYIKSRRPTLVQTRARQLARQMVNQRTGGYIGLEVKFYDQAATNQAPSNSATMTTGDIDPATDSLNCPPVGNNQSSRIGRKINMKSLTVKGIIKWRSHTTDQTPVFIPPVMIAIVLDTQNNSSTGLTTQNVFTNPGSSTSLCCNPLRNLEYTNRYRVLWKKVFQRTMPSAVQSGTPDTFPHSGIQVPFNIYLNLKDMPVLFNAESEDSTDIVDNCLHIVSFADNGTASGEVDVDIDYISRLRFVG